MLFLTTQNGTNIDNMVNKKVDSVIIYLRFLYYGDEGVSFIKFCIRTIKINCLKDRPIIFRQLADTVGSKKTVS